MPRKNLKRALDELEIYTKRRDLPVTGPVEFDEEFDMLASIPGLFDQDTILSELKILEK